MAAGNARAIRVLYSSNVPGLDGRVDELCALAHTVRAEPGCLEFDFFRSTEYPENFAQLELWDSPAAYDRHWQQWGSHGVFCDIRDLSAPLHRGRPELPRRDGRNGAEFYHYDPYAISLPLFIPADPADRIASIRWPSRSGVRIIIQSSTDPESDAAFHPYSAETRAQFGCLEFDFFRSLEFPENNLHLELWAGPPEQYDAHFYTRKLHAVYGTGLSRPPSTEVARRYGIPGFEFYQHGFSTLVGDVWQPEDPVERMMTVQWT